uniref:Uncharacterized protein n=1 Tax=Xenopus tropicalis TaxID=8364 RepID=A0A1B8Y8C1_XENTR
MARSCRLGSLSVLEGSGWAVSQCWGVQAGQSLSAGRLRLGSLSVLGSTGRAVDQCRGVQTGQSLSAGECRPGSLSVLGSAGWAVSQCWKAQARQSLSAGATYRLLNGRYQDPPLAPRLYLLVTQGRSQISPLTPHVPVGTLGDVGSTHLCERCLGGYKGICRAPYRWGYRDIPSL